MADNTFEACKVINNELLPRAKFLRDSFCALAEKARMDGADVEAVPYDGAVLAMDDIIATADKVMDLLER